MTESVGYLAAVLTTLSFVPQVVKAWSTKSVGDLSLGMLMMFATGIVLWLVYGVALRSLPIVSANAVTLVLTGILVGLKLRYR